jgi:hypothetical protein
MFERVERVILYGCCTGGLLGRGGILRVGVRRVVGRLGGWRSGRILRVTRILLGIRLVSRLRFSCLVWLSQVLTCSAGKRSMTGVERCFCRLAWWVFQMFFRIPYRGT